MVPMTKRIIAFGVAAAAVLGLAGVALANQPERASYGIDDAALALSAVPAAPAAEPAAGGKRDELKACVKAKVEAGGEKRAAVKECAAQLGVKPGKGAVKRDLRKAVHAELIVPKKGAEGQFETVLVDRGKVTTASADSISLQRPDGPTVTVKVVPATKVKGAASAIELTAGREVVVVSAGGEARSIVARA